MLGMAVLMYFAENFPKTALAGNRTPVSRVAGENSTTEPPMLENLLCLEYFNIATLLRHFDINVTHNVNIQLGF